MIKGDTMNDIEKLRQWFYKNRRFFPWREDPSPYGVWISEVMLQQTQATVVVSYFTRWMTLFPTIEVLAQAPLEKVLKAWEGLGYYARARFLHAGARYLTEHHSGKLPSNYEELKKIKGLGPYTIGAILSFAYKQRVAAVDGNVLRVLARYYGIEETIDCGAVQSKIRMKCQSLLPEDKPWMIMEGLIELGALICKKKAHCIKCPLMGSCIAYKKCKTTILPRKNKRTPIRPIYRTVAVIQGNCSLLIRRGEQGKVMHGLAEFPYFDEGEKIAKVFDLPLTFVSSLPKVSHRFTKYQAFLTPYLYQAVKQQIEGYEWIPFDKISSLPFSSGHRRILLHVKKLIPIS